MFDIKLLVAFVFLIFSVILIFTSQSRTNIVSTLIIIHLNLILFLSMTITNQGLFKEIILMLILYLIAALFIITNQDDIIKKVKKIKVRRPSFKIILFASLVSIFIFICAIFLTRISFQKMQYLRQDMAVLQVVVPEKSINKSLENGKIMRVAKKLHENYLLKHSSDLILIIIFLSGTILLFSSNSIKTKE